MSTVLDPATDCPVDDDGLPVHDLDAGALLPDGSTAWERLGVGHRCETWLAWSTERWCPVVVKFPRPHQTAHPRARATLRREVDALGELVHPALPRVLTDGTDRSLPFVTSEHVDGLALSDEIDDRGAFEPADTALLATQLLAGLRCVHARGRAHLDVKPDNIVLRSGRAVLLDFGSARPIGHRQPPNRPIGSPGYAAPDLESGAPVSAAMDLFGVGVTLCEALLGEPPFDPDDAPADRSVPGLPDGPVTDLVMALLADDPGDRPDLTAALRTAGAVAAGCGREPWPDFVSP